MLALTPDVVDPDVVAPSPPPGAEPVRRPHRPAAAPGTAHGDRVRAARRLGGRSPTGSGMAAADGRRRGHAWAACRSPRCDRAEVRRRIVVSDTARRRSSPAGWASGSTSAVVAASHAALATASGEDILDALPGGPRRPTWPSAAGASPAGSGSGSCWPARWPSTPRSWCWSSRPPRWTPTPRPGSPHRLHAHRAGRTTVVTTISPLLLDAVDEVAFLQDGRVVATGTHVELLESPTAGLPGRGHPRRRAGGGPMSTTLPVADAPAVRRYAGPGRASAPPDARRVCWPCTSLAALAALAAPRLLGDLVQAVESGTTMAYVNTIALVLAGFLLVQTVLTRYARLRLPGPRRAGAGRAARGLRRQRPGPAGGDRGVRRLRRPADPDLPRRRPARLVGALGAARVDHRAGHRGAHVRRRAERRVVGGPPLPARRARRW